MNVITQTPTIKKHTIKIRILILILSLTIFGLSTHSFAAGKQTTANLIQLANNNDIDAQYLLGYRYEMGIKVKRSHTSAIKWYKNAARKKHLDAQYRLGMLYFTQKKYAKARYWLAKRAKTGHADAQYYYAHTYRYALGTKEKTSTARKWYTKSAKQGHAKAQYELGLQYKKGIGARKNLRLAKYWFNKSAKQGNKQAKKYLTDLTGTTIARAHKPRAKKVLKKNVPNEQHKKITKEARNGDSDQQYELGMRYLLGYKTTPDSEQALFWLKKAAKKNHPLAQYQLANQYLSGRYLKKDLKLSLRYFRAAANQGVAAAKTALKHLDKTTQQ